MQFQFRPAALSALLLCGACSSGGEGAIEDPRTDDYGTFELASPGSLGMSVRLAIAGGRAVMTAEGDASQEYQYVRECFDFSPRNRTTLELRHRSSLFIEEGGGFSRKGKGEVVVASVERNGDNSIRTVKFVVSQQTIEFVRVRGPNPESLLEGCP